MGKARVGDKYSDLLTIQEEGGGWEEYSEKVDFPLIEPSPEARTSRRSSDSDSLGSSYKVLPPIAIEPERQSESESDFGREEDLAAFCVARMCNISERTLGVVLTELRKIDRCSIKGNISHSCLSPGIGIVLFLLPPSQECWRQRSIGWA